MRKFRILLLVIISSAEAQTSALAIADSLYATGNYTKAINHYAKEGSANGSLQIARAYNAIGNYEKAIVQYKSVVEQNADFQIASFELGKLLIKAKEYDEARKLFTVLASAAKENPEYHFYLGETFRHLHEPASSIVAYKKAVENDSTHLRSLFQLGKYFVVKQEKNQALHYIEKGLNFYPEDVAIINLKALVYFNDNAYEKAIPLFEKVLELGETKEYIYEKLAYCYYKNWDFEKAKTTYKTLIEVNPENSDSYYSLAEVFRREKQVDSARIFIDKGMKIPKPIIAKGYSMLGGLAREQQDLKMALEYYKLAHKEEPENAMGYYQVCTLVDRYYKDPKVKLDYYERYFEIYGKDKSYFTSFISKRIRELKEEIHFSGE